MVFVFSDELLFNIVQDWKKKDICIREKSELLKAYMNNTGVGLRELSRRIDTPYSTVQDWVTGRQMKKYYESKSKELDTLIDRLLFVITRKDYDLTPKTKKLLTELAKEINNRELLK